MQFKKDGNLIMQYRRAKVRGGNYFFTLVTHKRRSIFKDPDKVGILREVFRKVIKDHKFIIDAFVLMPDHLHCIWKLPDNDKDFPLRWQLIKSNFTREHNKRFENYEGKVWQGRFWEHLIRDEEDYKNHVEYIHYNPVKHGLIDAPKNWEYSSFHRFVKRNEYDNEWGAFEQIKFTEETGHE